MPWHDLQQLEQFCEVVLRSHLDAQKRLCWTATIKPLDPPGRKAIVTEAHEIQDAVRQAIEIARRTGLLSK